MNENASIVLKAALTHLRVQADQIAQAIAAVTLVLGETAETAETAETPHRSVPRQRAQRAPAKRPTARKGSGQTTRSRRATGNVEPLQRETRGVWQARALEALAMGPQDAMVRELATRLRIDGRDRDKSIQGLWNALQVLAETGQVVKNGPRYRLAGQATAA